MKSLDALVALLFIATIAAFVWIGINIHGISDSRKILEMQISTFSSTRDLAYKQIGDRTYFDTHRIAFEGIIENEKSAAQRRMHWVELLQSAKLHLGLAEASFEIYPYRLLVEGDSEFLLSVGQESIDIKLNLLHDGKLLELIQYLEQASALPFEITALRIERRNEINSGSGDEPHFTLANLVVHCTLTWYPIDVMGETIATS